MSHSEFTIIAIETMFKQKQLTGAHILKSPQGQLRSYCAGIIILTVYYINNLYIQWQDDITEYKLEFYCTWLCISYYD